MRLLHVTHPSGFEHDAGFLHPERPARLRAVMEGIQRAGVALEEVDATPIDPDDLAIVHDPAYVDAIRRLCAAGGGDLDPDTRASPETWPAALAAAGAGSTAVSRLENGFDGPAMVSVRPPGHHALRDRAMGFCIFNNVAVTAARLRDRGERVAIVDWDVHHGNGTQAMFYDDPDVLYVSLHQAPFYPYEGTVDETGRGRGSGTVVNIPLPSFTAGDVYREAVETIVEPVVDAFQPDWLLVSSGFDAHAGDPLAELRLVEADYHFLARSIAGRVRTGRVIVFLEGGYHLPALRDSVTAVVHGLLGVHAEFPPSEHRSPPESAAALSRTRSLLGGKVVGLD
ncbi:MAG TPA: histone deacetylase [Acidimicrobiia bacterium]|nr:histone deacetylase [Acidimicrobiia bacterium]